MKYAIDIDGVIGKKLRWSIGDSYMRKKKVFAGIAVNKSVVKAINRLYRLGNVIMLHTSRLWHDYDVTVKWLKKNGVRYHTLIMAKPLADYYIDDKNMSIGELLNDSRTKKI